LPGAAAIPAVHAERLRLAEATGTAAVAIAAAGTRPRQVVTAGAVTNALRVLLSLSGSTNAMVHLTAIAGRAGIAISPADLNKLSDSTPVLVNLKPVGTHYMEDFAAAGGMGALLKELEPLLDLSCRSVVGESLAERLAAPLFVDREVIRARGEPFHPVGGLVAVFGSLAPLGAVVKRAAATASLLEHEGRAVVFRSLEDLAARIDSPELDVTPADVLVLQNAGPRACGMPEAGYLPIPAKLARAGVTDMVRISDARMSGTAYGAIVLHVAPEAALGGPLALVRDGDRIRLSVKERKLDLLVPEAELARRRASFAPPPAPPRGYARLYHDTILQADRGCDFDFLTAGGIAGDRRAV
jgi:dihydroxy-acid dehydratase